jgi:ketopantoate reductase
MSLILANLLAALAVLGGGAVGSVVGLRLDRWRTR